MVVQQGRGIHGQQLFGDVGERAVYDCQQITHDGVYVLHHGECIFHHGETVVHDGEGVVHEREHFLLFDVGPTSLTLNQQ